MERRAGVLGVGNIGRHLVSRLVEAGYRVHAYDLAETAMEAARQAGAEAVEGYAGLARAVPQVLVSLPLVGDVRVALLGEEGLLGSMEPGGLVVDLSTGMPSAARELAARAAEREIDFVDAPVSWGEGGLNIMCGGTPAAFQRAEPALRVVGGKVTHVGPTGAGQVAKLVNQMVMAATWAAIGESFTYARGWGADPARVLEAIRTAGAASRLLDGAVGALISRDFGSQHTLALHEKDLWYALQSGRESSTPMPLTAFVQQVFESVLRTGDPEWGQTAIVTFWERMAGSD